MNTTMMNQKREFTDSVSQPTMEIPGRRITKACLPRTIFLRRRLFVTETLAMSLRSHTAKILLSSLTFVTDI